MSKKILLRRGLYANLPTLSEGEPGFCTDTHYLFIGSGGGNIQLPILPSIVLPASQVANQSYGIYESTVGLIRTFRPTGADGFNLFLAGAGNNTMLPVVAGDASYNIAIGRLSLIVNTTGHGNMAVGYETLNANTTGYQNIAIGYSTLLINTIGYNNVGIGGGALIENTEGHENIGIGMQSLRYNGAGHFNVGIGTYAMFYFTTGSYNTALGHKSLYGASHPCTGSFNTAIGAYSFSNCQTGDYNVGLGMQAGFYETGSNKLFIDNGPRADEADGRIKALIYGIFAAASANQRLRINGRLGVTECPNYANNAAALAGGLVSGEFYTITGSDPLQVARVI